MATYDEIKKQMDANSAAWHTATTQAEKDALHEANVKLASQLNSNATYDSRTGTWSGTGTTTSGGTGTTTSGGTGTTTSGGAYNAGTDYQALINSAVASGDYASAAKYEQQRNNKIQSEGLNNYQITNYYSDFLGGNKGTATNTTVNRDGKQLSAVVIGGKTYLTNSDGTFTGGKLKQGDAVSAANGTTYYYDEASGKGLTQEDYSKATRKAKNTKANIDIRTGRKVETVDYVDGLGNVTRVATVGGEPVQDGFTYNYVVSGDDGFEYEATATWSSTGGEDGKGGWTESVSNMPTAESYQASLQKLYDEYLAQAQDANQAAVDVSVQEIEANLENGLEDYSKSAAETYLKMLKAQQNQQLRNAAAGDLGGIGQKQYNNASAQYDAALLQIELEREAFINSCNQQIEQLKAQGRLQDAQILADWAKTKIDMYNTNYQWYQEMLLKKQQIDSSQNAEDRKYYYNRAVGMLEKGILTEDALAALGISEADARNYAAMLNEEASVSLAYAKAQLNNLYQKSAGGGGGGTPTTEQTDGGLSEAQIVGTVQVVGSDGSVRNASVYSDGTVDGLQAGDTFTMDGAVYKFDGSKIRGTQEADEVSTWMQDAQKALGTSQIGTPDAMVLELQRRANNIQAHIGEANAKLAQYNSYDFGNRVSWSGYTQGERYSTGANISPEESAAYAEWKSLIADLETYQQNLDTYLNLLTRYQQFS